MDLAFGIYDLTTDYAENPINLFTDKPVFSWKAKAYNGYKQTSYRICVSSSPEKLKNGIYDLWDSKTVKSDRSVAIRYEGKQLRSRDIGYWFVIVTDENGHTMRSETASFELALLCSVEWKGRFQAVTAEYCEGAQYWRRPFVLPNKKIKRARAYVCGLGYCEFYLNGKKIDDDRLSPGVTDYTKHILYVTYDITDELIVGGNCLGFILANGWFGGKMLNFQIYVDYDDGTVSEIHSYHNANELRVTYGPIKSASVYGGEVYDAREEARLKDWCTYDYHADYDNDWVFTMNASPPAGELVSQTFEPIKTIEYFEPTKVVSDENYTIYDFGVNLSGVTEIVVEGERGAKVTIRHSEILTVDKKEIDTVNLRTAKATDVYILKGDGQEKYSPSFTYHGFRYAKITTDGNVKFLSVRAALVRTAVKRISEFRCSDEVINKLHKNAVLTEGDNIHSVLTDCPQRDERYGWLNDYNSRNYELRYNYDAGKLLKKVVRDIADTQGENGEIADTAPFHIGQSPADPICVAFQLFSVENYVLRGDADTAKKYLPKMIKWVEYLKTRSSGNLLSYSYYGDWVTPYPIDDKNTKENEKTYPEYVSSVFYLWQVRLLAQIADIAGETDISARYLDLAEKIKAAVNEKYYERTNKSYHTGSQAANAFALSFGLCDESDKKNIAARIAEDIINRGYHNTAGNQGYRHLFYVMSDAGYSDLMIKLLVNPEYPGWGYMIKNDATSVWERWEAEGKIEMNSFNHPMFGGFDGWLFSKIAGLEFAKDCRGANKLAVKPYVPKNLLFVNAKTETAMGEYSVNWKRSGNTVVYEIAIPYNSEAVVSLGGVCKNTDCPFAGRYEGGRTVFSVIGGKYKFECEEENAKDRTIAG